MYIANDSFLPTEVVMMAGGKSAEYPGLAAFFASLYPDNVVSGRHFRFVESDAGVLAGAARSNSRMRVLLTSSDAATRAGVTVLRMADFRE